MLLFQDYEINAKFEKPVELSSISLFSDDNDVWIGFIFTPQANYQFFVDESVLFMSPEDVLNVSDVQDILDIKERMRFQFYNEYINKIVFEHSKLDIELSIGSVCIVFDKDKLICAKYSHGSLNK